MLAPKLLEDNSNQEMAHPRDFDRYTALKSSSARFLFFASLPPPLMICSSPVRLESC